jgi:hypothetical protein
MSREKLDEEHDVRIELASTPRANMIIPSNEEREGSEFHGITAQIIAVYLVRLFDDAIPSSGIKC